MSAPLDAASFAELSGVSRETRERLEAYAALLIDWSTRKNLVGRATLDDLWRRHILDSAQLLDHLPKAAAGVIDLGSGAGLPGLILAILGVGGVELVESDGGKCAFLREAARITATEITIHACRADAVPPHRVAVVTARACAPLARLLPLAQPFLGPGGICLFLKGERVAAELTEARKAWRMTASLDPSRSDPRGIVLRLEQVSREPRHR